MILSQEQLDKLDDARIDNRIDKEDVIRFLTTYGLQSKVSIRENELIAKVCKMIIDCK